MKYHTLFCQKLGKMTHHLLYAAVVIGALRVKHLVSIPPNFFVVNVLVKILLSFFDSGHLAQIPFSLLICGIYTAGLDVCLHVVACVP